MSKKIKVVTDSTNDLPKEVTDQLDVTVVPLSVTIDGQSYTDGVDITPEEFIDKLTKSDTVPQSSQPPAGVFAEVYDRLGEDGSEIISIHMTSGMSGTYNSAQTASTMTDSRVTVIDSGFISLALSFQVREAAAMAKEGFPTEKIAERLKKMKENSSLYIMVDTLEYLVKGGRIGRGKALVGSLLKIKPVASLADGVYTPVTKVRTHMQMVNFFRKKFEEETAGKKVKGIGIAHADAMELAKKLKESIGQLTDFTDIDIFTTTPIISTHTGPGALALMYYTD
ncbi:fatty acid-binding protein DegV [Alteribacter lacisalsi]|uniref:Fatty acid-binding protein DegV n=1 Tax=Alteribacter lacisalsi TaxID=2045244 RepID=A0A2W0H923_9BACI|nr:DegV family protein [Alteribacter lacisalsi]PYZ98353.1 fatty acid-binding protein DegV [Alteribacter lacisalsi]